MSWEDWGATYLAGVFVCDIAYERGGGKKCLLHVLHEPEWAPPPVQTFTHPARSRYHWHYWQDRLNTS
jgi:hypothetical protein